jgi:hypothetical protein
VVSEQQRRERYDGSGTGAYDRRQQAGDLPQFIPIEPELVTFDQEINVPIPEVNITVTVGRGDSISRILGTSDPKAMEAFMRANPGVRDGYLREGREYNLPGAEHYAASSGRAGQAILSQHNADQAALAAKREFDQLHAMAAGDPTSFSGTYARSQLTGVPMQQLADEHFAYVARQRNAALAERYSTATSQSWRVDTGALDRIVSDQLRVADRSLGFWDRLAAAFAAQSSMEALAGEQGLNAALAPLALAESSGQHFASAQFATTPSDRQFAYLNSFSDATNAFGGALGVAVGASGFTSVLRRSQTGTVPLTPYGTTLHDEIAALQFFGDAARARASGWAGAALTGRVLPLNGNLQYLSRESFWTAPSSGTGYQYRVFQQDIDWTLSVGGRTNLELARSGNAPYVRKNGTLVEVNLHHSRQSGIGPLFELSRPTHLNVTNLSGRLAVHPFTPRQNPYFPVQRDAFRTDMRQYWMDRAAGVGQ